MAAPPAVAGRPTAPTFRTIGASSRNVTVNLGLAWNLTSPISEVANRYANFNPANGQFLIAGNTPFGPNAGKWVGIQFDKDALEPRLGVAWKPWGSDRTVVRAGYAIFHDSAWSQGAQGLWQNPPYYAESDVFAFTGAGFGCTFATAACATLYGQTPSAASFSSGFQDILRSPQSRHFHRHHSVPKSQFQAGHGSAIQRQRRTRIAGPDRAHRGIRRLAQQSHPDRRQ